MGNKITQCGMQRYPQHRTSDDDYDNQIIGGKMFLNWRLANYITG